MKITRLPAYTRFKKWFLQNGYTRGKKFKRLNTYWIGVRYDPNNLPPGYYINAYYFSDIRLEDIPTEYLTREFFLHTLSSFEAEIINYVRADSTRFDKQFYKDYLETNEDALDIDRNIFEYMPLEFIDQEMVACAILKAIDRSKSSKCGLNKEWFYSIHKRKPELLTSDMYILVARCLSGKKDWSNRFIEITPEEYRTEEYYLALCFSKEPSVMADIPESVLTMEFLEKLLKCDPENIKCFTETALERNVRQIGRGRVKCWQAALYRDGYQIRNIPLNDERIRFFLALYKKDSPQYKNCFKELYESYCTKSFFAS